MQLVRIVTCCCALLPLAGTVEARVWTDSSGNYKLDAELVAFSETTVVLKRADHELVAVPIAQLSDLDREYLKSPDAGNAARKSVEEVQTWSLRDGTKVVGRIVDYARVDMTVQRRRGRIYVNDRVLQNLPEFYQQLVPRIVAHLEDLPTADRRALEAWLIRQRGQPKTFRLEGVVLETSAGDEYGVPFFLLSDEDLKVLKPGWDAWLALHGKDDHDAQAEQTFLLRSLAAARHRDQLVQREIAMLQLKLQAVQAGLTSLWEVTLFPAAGQRGRPQWVVVPGRDSRQATENALRQFPGHSVGPVRRVSR